MDNLKDYFLQFRNRVSFIELKEGTNIDINGYKVEAGVPLPLLMEDLIGEIKVASDEIKFSNMVDGMIYTIGIDETFPYAEDYKKMLKAFNEKIENNIIYTGNTKFEEGDIEDGMIYLRAAYALNKFNLYGIYNYSIALEEKAKKLYEAGDKELGTKFLTEAMKKMEELRNKDENGEFNLAHYKLGFYYKAYGKNIKAKEEWETFIEKGEGAEVDEVREQLEAIADDVQYEEGCAFILEGKPKEGVEKLLPLTKKYEKWWNLDFMTGVGLRQLGNFEDAIIFFKRVLEVNPAQTDTLNEMGLCKANTGDMEGAEEFFSKALMMDPKNYEILCNRGMARLQLGKDEEAIADIDRAYEMNPEDPIIQQCRKVIENYESK